MISKEKCYDELIMAYDYRNDYTEAEEEDRHFWEGVIHGLKIALEKQDV